MSELTQQKDTHLQKAEAQQKVLDSALALLKAINGTEPEAGENIFDLLESPQLFEKLGQANLNVNEAQELLTALWQALYQALQFHQVENITEKTPLSVLLEAYKQTLTLNTNEQAQLNSEISELFFSAEGRGTLIELGYDRVLENAILQPKVNDQSIPPHDPMFLVMSTGHEMQVQSFPMGRVWTTLDEDQNGVTLQDGSIWSWEDRWHIKQIVVELSSNENKRSVVFDQEQVVQQLLASSQQ